MIALSLNVHQKVHPIIWSTNNLPFDSQYVLPVPRPIGGVLIFCTNILIYLNQSVPPFAVSLNSFAESSTAFPLTAQRNLKISLDCSKACFLSNDKLVISLKGGEIYVVTLFIDRMRSVKRFHFEKAASTVISSCLTFCGKEFLFLGSRLGNSLLLKYTEKIVNIQPPKFFDEKIINDNNEKIKKLSNGLTNDKVEDNNNNDDKMEAKISNHIDIDQQQEKLNEETLLNDNNSNDSNDKIESKTNEITSFVNDNLEENDLYGENEFIFKEKPIENYKKRKIDEIEFDDEDKELYGDDDPIFNDEETNNIQQQSKNNESQKLNLNTDNLNEKDDNLYNNKEQQQLKDLENNKEQLNTDNNINALLNNQQNDEINNEEENLKNLFNNTGDDLELYNETSTNIFNDENFHDNQENINHTALDQQKDNIGDWMAGDIALLKDTDELEIFGVEENDDKLPITLVFQVCDSLLNIGPCSRFCMGELSFLAEELEKENEHQIELVTTSGYGKNGALCVLQRTIRPQIVTTFVLPKCSDMWTVYSLQKDIVHKDNATNDPKHHAYLILSRSETTMILQTGQEINELDQSGFICNSRTIFAGNLYNNKYIIQVSSNTIRLIEGKTLFIKIN